MSDRLAATPLLIAIGLGARGLITSVPFVCFDISTLDLTYDAAFAFGQKCELILADLGKLLTHTHWEPSHFSEMSAEQGKALWLTLAKSADKSLD